MADRDTETLLVEFGEMDPRTNTVRRDHVGDHGVQKAVADAVRKAGMAKHASVHSLRHSFATHILLQNVDIRQVQELRGHAHVETTMIDTHVVKGLRHPPRSPLDTRRKFGRSNAY